MTWYAVEIIYDGAQPGTVELHRIKNFDRESFMKFREDIFTIGLYIAKDGKATEGRIVPPARLRSIDVFMQRQKFE